MSETEGMSPTVQTFVIFDLETTGFRKSNNNPRITELSFIALPRDGLLDASKPSRVASKLLLCFNPQKEIDPKASSMSGLNNDALEAYGTFESHAPLICSFLTNLPEPACLVAHNGNGFDFPILISELNNAKQPVPENILCVDSLKGFKGLDGPPKKPEFVNNKRKNRSFTAVVETANSEANKETLDPNICHSVSPSKKARLSEDVPQLGSIDAETPQHSYTVGASQGPSAKNNRKKSYSLPQLYKSIFGQDPTESHAAEGDCKTLLRVIQTNALSFCQWCDKNAEPLVNKDPCFNRK